jgi:hypothetical protein
MEGTPKQPSSSSVVYEDPDEFIAELKLSLAEVVDELSHTDGELSNERKRTETLRRYLAMFFHAHAFPHYFFD